MFIKGLESSNKNRFAKAMELPLTYFRHNVYELTGLTLDYFMNMTQVEIDALLEILEEGAKIRTEQLGELNGKK